jgi:hypothetical protein
MNQVDELIKELELPPDRRPWLLRPPGAGCATRSLMSGGAVRAAVRSRATLAVLFSRA